MLHRAKCTERCLHALLRSRRRPFSSTIRSGEATTSPRIVMLGAPGSGKGTYSRAIAGQLVPNRQLPILSTGDIIRAEIASRSSLGVQAKSYTDSGGLVPDSIVIETVLSRLDQQLEHKQDRHLNNGFILDGFPRTISQASALESYREGLHAPTTVVNVLLDEDVIVAKLLGRRVCCECGASYNVANVRDDDRGIDMPAMAPPAECEMKLELRSDDTQQVIERRLAVYKEETAPLIAFYGETGHLVNFQVKKGMRDVEKLRQIIRKHEKLVSVAEAWAV